MVSWSFDKWKTLYLTSAWPMASKLDRVVASNEGLLSTKSHNVSRWDHITNKKNYIFHFHKACDPQTWQDGGLWWGTTNHKVTRFFDHALTWGHVTNEKRYIFPSARPLATKLDRVIAYKKGSPTTIFIRRNGQHNN